MPRIIQNLLILAPIIALFAYIIYSRSNFQSKANAGPFFFENGCLVLNTLILYKIPLHEIECVEVQYHPWELEHKLSYSAAIKVIRKNGTKKRVFYKGYRMSKLALPSDMQAALLGQGVRCVMIDQ